MSSPGCRGIKIMNSRLLYQKKSKVAPSMVAYSYNNRRRDHKVPCSPFNLLRIDISQELLHLPPAAQLVFWVPRQVVQD